MRVLCYVNHYFGEPVGFVGKSTEADNGERRAVVAACLAHLRALPGADVRVCGIAGRSLEPIDIDFPHLRSDPKLLVYESLAHMARAGGDYDYFVNIEDDILLPAETFENVVAFDRSSLVNEILHPNRLETDDAGRPFCVDLRAMPGWTHQRRTYEGRELRVALNPHSGVLILHRDKLRHALDHIDLDYRGRFLKYEMDSAFAYFHSPFSLYRPYEDLEFHTVTHLDRYAGPREPAGSTPSRRPATEVRPAGASTAHPTPRWKAIVRELVPPILLRLRRRRR